MKPIKSFVIKQYPLSRSSKNIHLIDVPIESSSNTSTNLFIELFHHSRFLTKNNIKNGTIIIGSWARFYLIKTNEFSIYYCSYLVSIATNFSHYSL